MKASEVYRKAAEYLDAQTLFYNGACLAIDKVRDGPMRCDNDHLCHACAMEELFKDDRHVGYWLGGDPNAENKPVRVLALCLMAAIAEEEERRD